jgi:hypothetical protein
MATMSPELILASCSCGRRDHMVRFMRTILHRVAGVAARPTLSRAQRTECPHAQVKLHDRVKIVLD